MKACQRKPRSIVIQTPNSTICCLPEAKAILQTVSTGVNTAQKRLWLVSGKPLTEAEAIARKEFLRRNVYIYWDKETGLVSVSGRPERKRKPKPVNLMNNPWIKALKERIEGRYETEGWRVLSGVEVEQSLRNCRFAPEAYRRLRDGYGFLVQASCGCLYKINLKGETFLAYHCEEGEDCQSILLPAKENRGPVFVGRDIPLSTRCFDCGSAFLMDSILGRKGKKGYTEVIFDIKCPRCKQAVSRTGSTWVSYDRLIFVRK